MQPMKRYFFCLTLLVSLQITSVAGELERDNLIYAAASAEGTEKALLLIRAAEQNPDDAAVPLAMLTKVKLSPLEKGKIIRKYDELWAKYPDHQEIVHYGLLLHKGLNSFNTDVLDLLKKSRKNYSSGNREPDFSIDINSIRLYLHTLFGDSKDGAKFAETLDHNIYFIELSSFYHVASYRARIGGNIQESEQLYQKYMQTVRHGLNMIPPKPEISELTGVMIRLFKNREFEHAELLFAEIKKRTANQTILDNVRAIYCLHTHDFTSAKKEASLIKNISIDINLLTFTAAMNSGSWKEAEKLLSTLPEAIRQEESLKLAVSMGSAESIAAAADDPQKNLTVKERALCKFQAAGMMQNKKLYFEAKKMLGNMPLSIDDLNTIGYTAAELGVDLKESESMLRRAVKSSPYSAAYLDSLAYICFLKRRYAEAEKLINRALDCITPDIPPSVILEHAADIALAQGDFIKAKTMYQRAVDLGKNDILFNSIKVKNKLDRLK